MPKLVKQSVVPPGQEKRVLTPFQSISIASSSRPRCSRVHPLILSLFDQNAVGKGRADVIDKGTHFCAHKPPRGMQDPELHRRRFQKSPFAKASARQVARDERFG